MSNAEETNVADSAATHCSLASISELRSIAWLANQIVGGGCCQEHIDQHWRNLQEKLRLFVDDSYTQLKSERGVMSFQDSMTRYNAVNHGQ